MIKWIDHLRFGKQAGYEVIFRRQEMRLQGQPGIILAEIGMPEGYDFSFYNRYMQHVFNYALPFFIRPLVLADRGIALIDPDHPLAREAFIPKQLIDAYGSFTNHCGIPYAACKTTWKKPGMPGNPWDHGYFLYKEEGNGGAPDICQKTGAKVKGWYFDRLLPERKLAWAYQHRLIYEETFARLENLYPQVPVVQAFYAINESLWAAVETLLNQGCHTIIYQCYSNPVYSDFEDYGTTIPLLHSMIAGRARLVIADQVGCQPHLPQGFVHRINDLKSGIPPASSLFVILSTHGHPFRKDTMDLRAALYRQPVETAVREALTAHPGRWALTWSQDEYAEIRAARRNGKQATSAAYLQAAEEGFDYVLELPTEFFAESTDTMIFHAMKKFHVFDDYDRNQPIPYPDWDQPLVRRFRRGSTTAIYGGCLVGPYRSHVVDAVTASVTQTLQACVQST